MSLDQTSDDVNAAVGRQIAQRRRALGLTLAELSAACGVSLQQIHKYETGQSAISVEKLVRVAHRLHLKPSQLLDAAEPPPGPLRL